MNLILIGCEYSGTSTLAVAINEWAVKHLGGRMAHHDHWKMPHSSGHPPAETITNLTEEEQQQVLGMTPKLKELFSRYTLYYHTVSSRQGLGGPGGMLVGYYFEELVYGPMYFAYGGDGEPGDRRLEAQNVERRILQFLPNTVLVLLKASPRVIRARMKEAPHHNPLMRDKDVERVQRRFEEEYNRSALRHKITLDTSAATVGETLAEFFKKVEPFLTESDRLRMLTASL
jgi:hypothetical protein